MTPNRLAPARKIDTVAHYDMLVAEPGGDPFRDPPALQAYMRRWDGDALFSRLGQVEGKDVLEVGIGTGRLAKEILATGCRQLTGIDPSPASLRRAEENLGASPRLRLICAGAETFSATACFDFAYSSLTFMHIRNKAQALVNVANSLRPKGKFVLSLNNHGNMLNYNDRTIELYPWSVDEYLGAIETAGMKVESVQALIDAYVNPDGSKSKEYGQSIGHLIVAGKQATVLKETP